MLTPGKRPVSGSAKPGNRRGGPGISVAHRPHVWSIAELWTAFRRLHGPKAEPRSEQQWLALRRTSEACAQLLVMLPTGAGKSSVFLTASTLPGCNASTVVILPLVALRQDLISKCYRLKAYCYVWTGAEHDVSADLGPLIFVSVELAVTMRFKAWLQHSTITGRLGRIVMDEAHLVLTAANCHLDLALLSRLRAVPVEFIALTATLPPLLERAWRKMMHFPQPEVVRSPSDRPSLKYRVRSMALLEPYTARPQYLVSEGLEAPELLYLSSRSDIERIIGGG